MSSFDQEQLSTAGRGGDLAFETLLADLSTRFVNLPPEDVDREIEGALRRVCELLGIELAVLWQWSTAVPSAIHPTHTYFAEDGSHFAEPLRQEQFPWYIAQLLAGHVVAVPSLEDFPPEAAVDRESCRLLGIKSNLTLPLAVGGEPPLGALGLNTLTAARDWPGALVARLQLAAQVITNALARKRRELALRESEARLALAADSAEAGLWTLDFRTGVFWATKKALALFGYSPDEIVDIRRFEASVHADDRERVLGTIERAARTGEPIDLEYRIIHAGDGPVRWIASRGRPHPGSAGELDRLMGVSIDVTERKLGEETLRESRNRTDAAAELAGLGFYEVDLVRGFAYFDDRLTALCGVPPDRTSGLAPIEWWLEHLHPEDRQAVLEERHRLHAGSVDRISVEYRFLHPAEGQKWVHHRACVTSRDATGRAVKTFGVLRDNTEHRLREEALRRSYAEIERLKDRLQAESDYLKAEIQDVHAHGEITGQSAAIRRVLRQVEQVAPTDSSVLIRGETGTGKELLAQAIHRLSARGRNVMVKVNCAALPSGLVESELFGQEKGAFTGALTRQVGRFEVADGSTIFLDEVGELPADIQVKLLRVLQEGEFERLGSPRTIKVNVRVIAATNRDLLEEVRKGRFREDLYYRLNVFPIRMPPLRDRPDDIPLLVWTFLGEFNTRMGKKITQVPRATMEALQRQPWPGNIRELRNVIERGAIVTTGDMLQVTLAGDAAPSAAPAQTLADAEREHILRELARTGWRIKGPNGAAAALGLNPATLYSRMKKLGIELKRQTRDGAS